MRKIILVLCISFILSKSLRILQQGTTKEGGAGDATTTDQTTQSAAENMSKSGQIKTWVNDLTESYDRVAKSIYVTKHQEIKEIIERDGWDKLHLKSNIFIMNGLLEEKYYEYVYKRGKALKLRGEIYEHYNITAEYGPWTIDNALWNKCDFIYSDENIKNSYDSFTVLASQGRKEGAYDILISQLQIFDFKIADDLIWIKQSNDYAQFFKEDKEEFIKRPNILTEKKLEALVDVFKILSFKFLADTFGVKVQLPSQM